MALLELVSSFPSDAAILGHLTFEMNQDKWKQQDPGTKAFILASFLTLPFTRNSPHHRRAASFLTSRDPESPEGRDLLRILDEESLREMHRTAVILTKHRSKFLKGQAFQDDEAETALKDLFAIFGIEIEAEIWSEEIRIKLLSQGVLENTFPKFPTDITGPNHFIVPAAEMEIVDPQPIANAHCTKRKFTTTMMTGLAPSGQYLVDYYCGLILGEFVKHHVVRFFAPTGSGKSTTLIWELMRHFTSVWVLVPNNTAANLLFQTYNEYGIKCGLRCGRPSVDASANVNDSPLMILTYGAALHLVSRGVLPKLIVMDEINAECDDRDIIIKFLQSDRWWQGETKVLGITANTIPDCRAEICSLQDAPIPTIEMVTANKYKIVTCTRPQFLLPQVRRLIRDLLFEISKPDGARNVERLLRAKQVSDSTQVVVGVENARESLQRILDAWQLPTFCETVAKMEAAFDPRFAGVFNRLQRDWRPLSQALYVGEVFPKVTLAVELIVAYLETTAEAHRDANEHNAVPLVFCSGMQQMKEFEKELRLRIAPTVDVVLFHSQTVDHAMLAEVTRSPLADRRRIILSSSLGETSVTLDKVGFVIDTGVVKKDFQQPVTDEKQTFKVKTSAAQAQQRKGRTGRKQDGVYTSISTNLPTDDANFQYPVPRNSMNQVLDVILEFIVFHQARDDPVSVENLVNIVVETTKHGRMIVEAGINELEKYCLIVIKDSKVLITRGGYEAYCIPCDVGKAFMIVLGARLGVLRSTLWYCALLEEFPEGLYHMTDIAEIYSHWNTFFRSTCTYNLERMTEFRSFALFMLQSKNEKDSATRCLVDFEKYKSAKAEKIIRGLYPDCAVPIYGQDNDVITSPQKSDLAYGGGLNRNEDRGIVAMLAGVVGSRHKIVGILDTFSGLHGSERTGFANVSHYEECTSKLLPHVGFHGSVFTGGNKAKRIPSVTAVPHTLAALTAHLFDLPTNIKEQEFSVEDLIFETPQVKRFILFRRRFRELLEFTLAPPGLWHPAYCNEKIDEYLQIVSECTTPAPMPRSAPQQLALLNTDSRSVNNNTDDVLMMLQEAYRKNMGVPEHQVDLDRPLCAVKTPIWLPPTGKHIHRGFFCNNCFSRGHLPKGCIRECLRMCEHKQDLICMATPDEVLKRRRLLLDQATFDYVLPANDDFFPGSCRVIQRAVLWRTSAAVKEFLHAPNIKPHCDHCKSPLHNWNHSRCFLDEITCIVCKYRHSDNLTPEACEFMYAKCLRCNMRIHPTHRCEEALRLIYRKFGPSYTMLEYRQHLDSLCRLRYSDETRQTLRVSSITQAETVVVNDLRCNEDLLLPRFNPQAKIDRYNPNDPNDIHYFAQPKYTF